MSMESVLAVANELKDAKNKMSKIFKSIEEYQQENIFHKMIEGFFNHEEFLFTLNFYKTKDLHELFEDWTCVDDEQRFSVLAQQLRVDLDKFVLIEFKPIMKESSITGYTVEFYMQGQALKNIFESYSAVFQLINGKFQSSIKVLEDGAVGLDLISEQLKTFFQDIDNAFGSEESIDFQLMNCDDSFSYVTPTINDEQGV